MKKKILSTILFIIFYIVICGLGIYAALYDIAAMQNHGVPYFVPIISAVYTLSFGAYYPLVVKHANEKLKEEEHK